MPYSPLVVSWEADYSDGKTIAERDGWSYDRLPREGMTSFALVAPGTTLIRVFTDSTPNRHPNTLVYRRRQRMGADTTLYFMVGFMNGDVAAYFPANDEVRWGKFEIGDPIFNPPAPTPGENWHTFKSHASDVDLRRDTVRLPSGYELKV